MQVDLGALSGLERYQLMIQSIVPRPIAWVLTENEDKTLNLAPFSYFNAVHGSPPLVMMSIGNKSDQTHKDTRRNFERTQTGVIHIASGEHAELVTRSSLPLEPGVSEVEDCGLEPIADWKDDSFKLPRLKGVKIAWACSLERVIEIGANKQGLLFAELKEMYIDDSVCSEKDGSVYIDAMKLDPICRLGGNDYGILGKTLTVDRPEYRPG